MLPRGILVQLEIVLLALYANGQYPLFVCRQDNTTITSTVDIVPIQGDQIVIVCLNLSTVDYLIDRVTRTSLLAPFFHLQMNVSDSNLNVLKSALSVLHLDLSDNNLNSINLTNFRALKTLNLTSNRIRSFNDIKLHDSIHLASLDLSRNQLMRFDHSTLPSCQKLYLHSNNIFDLNVNVTLHARLLELDLTRNELENLSNISFISSSLTVLNLSINLINAVSINTFAHLPNLEHLILQCNKLFDIETDTFIHNVKLIELNLRDNNLSVLKKSVFDYLPNLQKLDISKNNFLRLPSDIMQNLNYLTDFSLSENVKLCGITECDRQLNILLTLGAQLQTLRLRQLRLRQFPVLLTTTVQCLDLSKNTLSAIRLGDLDNFPFLDTLILTDNQIQVVEDDVFARTEFLQTLCLDDNKLQQIPDTLPSTLRKLYLDNNRIIQIKATDLCLVNLTILKLNSNQIRSIESGSFVCLTNLHTLDISDNPILRLNTDTFDGLINLHIFYATDLHNVQINSTNLRYFPVSEIPNLQYLNISRSPDLVHSFLNDIPLLVSIKQIDILDLSYANLVHIPFNIQTLLSRLKLLRLVGNPLNCSAEYYSQNWTATSDFSTCDDNLHDIVTNLSLKVSSRPINIKSINTKIESSCPLDLSNTVSPYQPENDEFWTKLRLDKCRINTKQRQSSINNNSVTSELLSVLSSDDNSTIADVQTTHIPLLKNNFTTEPMLNTFKHTLQVPPIIKQFAQTEFPSSISTSLNIHELPLHLTSTNNPIKRQDKKAHLASTVASLFAVRIHEKGENDSKVDGENFIISNVTKSTTTTLDEDNNVSPSLLSTSDDDVDDQTKPMPFSAAITGRESAEAVRIVHAKNNIHASTIQLSPSSLPAAVPSKKEGHYESLVWNQTDYTFSDWFPAYQNINDSDEKRIAEAMDAAERSATNIDNVFSYTHPGVVIFSAVMCFLIVLFVSIFIPSCLQKYKLQRQRYKISELDDYQPSIEISSISAFVDSEIPLDP